MCRFDAERFAGHLFEWCRVPRSRPELELRVAARAHLQQVVVSPIVQVERADDLRVAAIQAFRQPENGGESPHRAPTPPFEIAKAIVAALRRGLAVIARDERYGFDLVGFEPAQLSVTNQVEGVLVVSLVADVHADVMQDRRIFEPFALAIREPMNRPRLVEQRDREPRNLLRVLRRKVAPLRELENAATPDVGITVRLRDLASVPRDVVEHQPFTQRQITQREVGCAQAPEDLVEQNRAGDRKVGAARLEAGHTEPFLEFERSEFFAQPANLLGRNAAIAERAAGRAAIGRNRDGAEAQNRARCADHAVEACARDLVKIAADLRVDMSNEFSFIPAIQGITLDEPFGQPDDPEFETAADVDG